MKIMSEADLLVEAKRLSVAERLDLIDRLIESVETEATETAPEELKSEMDRRYQAHLARPEEAEPWEVVRERIQRSLNAGTSGSA